MIRGVVYLILGFAFFGASTAWGEVAFFSNEAQDKLKAYLAKDDYVSVATQISATCNSYIDMARPSSAVKIQRRAAAAADAVNCLQKGRAVLIALSPNIETQYKVKEFMQPFLTEAERLKQQADSEVAFMGISWGLGFGFSFGFDDAINDAEIVNGIVRSKSEKRQQPRAFLEFHKYFLCYQKNRGTRGCGPFVAVSASEDKVLSGVGMGLMYGQKVKSTDSEGFSIGAGIMLDGKVRDLASGFKEDQPPPPGETTVRFKEKARWSWILFVTRTF